MPTFDFANVIRSVVSKLGRLVFNPVTIVVSLAAALSVPVSIFVTHLLSVSWPISFDAGIIGYLNEFDAGGLWSFIKFALAADYLAEILSWAFNLFIDFNIYALDFILALLGVRVAIGISSTLRNWLLQMVSW